MISKVVLRSPDPDAQRAFYADALGMSIFADGSVGYGHREARLVFEPADGPYEPSPIDRYWKIALGVPNIELACEQLTERGVAVDAAHQFRDVGYLAHFRDPSGFTIELIDHWFLGNRPPGDVDDDDRLGGGAHLNLVTLRTIDIESVQRTCERWGMTPLSIQPVDEFGFTLHFFAFTDERPPNPDLRSVDNREWLYQRPYTVLEIQHVHEAEALAPPRSGAAGYEATVFAGPSGAFTDAELGIRTEEA